MKGHFIERSITESTYLLLKEERVDKIKITDLTDKAKVSRNSFYRYYDSVQDVVKKDLELTVGTWYKESGHEYKNSRENVKDLLQLFYDNRERFLILHNSGCDSILCDFLYVSLNKYMKNVSSSSLFETAGLTGFIYGVLKQWFRNQIKETPEEVYNSIEKQLNSLL